MRHAGPSWDDPIFGEVTARDDNSITILWSNYYNFRGRGPYTNTWTNKEIARNLNQGDFVLLDDYSRSVNQNTVTSSAHDDQIRADNEKVFARLGIGASR